MAVYVLFKNELKAGNNTMFRIPPHMKWRTAVKQRWRVESEFYISRNLIFQSRMEFVLDGISRCIVFRQGFLGMAGLRFSKISFSGNLAFTVLRRTDYDTRIYTYESDVLYSYSIPAYYGRGIHYFINLHRDFSR